ncbi:MAG: HAD-IA family hydrolase [Dactylosporangium sp.]|nr:HAD-IA family hydrolase [Dactylosporangium sp.]NNJ60421.1 HAD-IA family hydrolase [Dactylosporangium sp.]
MHRPEPSTAVLFDLDGTLVDSAAAITRCWTRICATHRLDLDEVLRIHAGRPATSTIRLVAPRLAETAVAAIGTAHLALEYDDTADVTARPGALDLIAELDRMGLPWAVVTSGDRRLAEARLDAAGISTKLLITTDDVTTAKPDPEGYLLAARILGVPASGCVVVEDAAVGIEAGRRAGMRVIGVEGAPAEVVVAQLMDLLDLL